MMMGVLKYWDTLRHLHGVQIYGRIWFRLSRPRIDTRPCPSVRQHADGRWVTPPERRPSLSRPTRFTFLNEIHDLEDVGWDDDRIQKLWRYNLHYFDDLNAMDARTRADLHGVLLTRWVQDNRPGVGTGWEPYPTSLRIVNWTKWALRGNELPAACLQSLAVQARWLMQRLEIHLQGNHLFANAKALVFAGAYFNGPEADVWRKRGLAILRRQIAEQVLLDGAHFELSTMYHALALEDMLDLINLAAAYPDVFAHIDSAASEWRARIAPMRRWLEAMCHPDGEIGFFNDAATGVAPTRDALQRYAVQLGFGDSIAPSGAITNLSASGYVRSEQGELVALLDVARVGPDHLPGHGHADTLSFEVSLFGERVFVNSGTSRYNAGPERLRERGTAAHNTVLVDGENSSEVWGAFGVARRARPIGLELAGGNEPRVRCGHDGYLRLPGRVVHTREWIFGAQWLMIEDSLAGSFARAEARFHLHPNVTLDGPPTPTASGASLSLRVQSGSLLRVEVEGGGIDVESDSWHPEFGIAIPNQCVVVTFSGAAVRTVMRWGVEHENPNHAVCGPPCRIDLATLQPSGQLTNAMHVLLE
jgi:uncharacterized heparinase superfamily protein